VKEVTDRSYWEKRASKPTLEMMDALMGTLKGLDPSLALQYNKFYIGMAKNGQANNFVVFKPKKDWLRVEPRLEQSEAIQKRLDDEPELDVMEYANDDGRYRIRLGKGDVQKHEKLLNDLLRQAYEQSR
jgi:hypothetical protein